jgi:hypothetical protein
VRASRDKKVAETFGAPCLGLRYLLVARS